jgi:hypothetical protein
MKKIKLPQKSFKGLKTFCKICRINNSKCSHIEHLIFRAVIKIPGGCGSVRTKMLIADSYNDAVIESIQFRKDLEANNFESIAPKIDMGNDYSVIGALLKYNQYIQGDSEYAHLKKNITSQYKDELLRYCTLFSLNL